MDGEGRSWIKRRGKLAPRCTLYILKPGFQDKTIATVSGSRICINLMLSLSEPGFDL